MGIHFTEEQIDIFFEMWLAEFPHGLKDAVEILGQDVYFDRARLSEIINQRRIVADKIPFFIEYKKNKKFPYLDLETDVMSRIRDRLENSEL